ncbi:winged helix-turn-helix domain-containing protein [Desulfobulbus alkaliphilus]|uniref:winged helix-turn-helix domain-containing protein n=1 Tax=Desulfobulbus alkaliphilus TaxID=869814 RepID=UPI001964EF04|nr:winged helix-turn-helix domain-containing protein [Desulfobulbus alkaliphilus]MBM9538361.1 winged helix-turn-helix transcriptional regulator [Desulfobulbus alkaliphilus]
MHSLFSGLITSKTRIKILMRLFLNPQGQAYLRELAEDFQISPSQVKEELDQLRNAKLLVSKKNGRQVIFSANQQHPVFNELHSMVKKALGMDEILESIIMRLGNLRQAILIDDYAEGKDTGIIDLVLIGDIDTTNLLDLSLKTEKYIGRKIRTLVLSEDEYHARPEILKNRPRFVLWRQEAV